MSKENQSLPCSTSRPWYLGSSKLLLHDFLAVLLRFLFSDNTLCVKLGFFLGALGIELLLPCRLVRLFSRYIPRNAGNFNQHSSENNNTANG